jgi:NAD(P)H-dependent FMN reductase
MSVAPRILAFAGSTRTESYNKRLIRIAANGAREAGAEINVIDLRDFPLPLFDEDLEREQGTPEAAKRLKGLMVEHDAFLISSPEYNSSISAVLKNAIDWVSRPVPGESPLIAFRGKAVTIMSASPSALGGLRGLVHLRSILANIGVIVLPDQVTVPRAFEAFLEDGTLKDPKHQQTVVDLGKTLVTFVGKIKP